MQTETQTTVGSEADSFLAQGIANLPGIDTSDYHTKPSSNDDTALKNTEDRGTPDLDDQTSTETAKAEEDNASTSAPEAEGESQTKPKSRAQARIPELLTKIKNLEKQLAEGKQAAKPSLDTLAKSPEAKPTETPQFIPKPKYKVEDLKKAIASKQYELDEFQAVGDLQKMRETRSIIETLQEELHKTVNWEKENNELVQKHNNSVTFYRQKIIEQLPEIVNPDSPIRKEFDKVSQRFTELQKNPALYEYELAGIANLRLRASKVAVLEEQNKKLQQELDSIKNKVKPMTQDTATRSGTSDDKMSAEEFLVKGLRSLRVPTTY